MINSANGRCSPQLSLQKLYLSPRFVSSNQNINLLRHEFKRGRDKFSLQQNSLILPK